MIEEVITRHVYDGKAFVKPQKKIKPQGPTLYEKVRESGKTARLSPDWVEVQPASKKSNHTL